MTNFLVRTLIESAPKPGKPGTGMDEKPASKKSSTKKKVIPPSADEDAGDQKKTSGLDTFDPGKKKKTKDKKETDAPGTLEDQLKLASFKNLAENVSSMDNPYYFVVSGRNSEEKLKQFLSENNNIIQSKNCLLFFKGTKNELAHLYLWFVSGNVVGKLVGGANDAGLPHASGPVPKSFFSEDTPFNSLKFGSLDKVIGNIENFRKALNIQWNKTRAENTDDAVDAYPSFQMSSRIDVNYLRFFNKKQREYELYVGGQMPNAGQTGYMYPLVSAQESASFKKMFQNIIMPALFYRDMFVLSDVDQDLKTIDPTKLTPANALIVFAQDGEKFEPNKKYKDENTQLMGLELLAQSMGAPKIKPKFGDTKVLIGSHNVHFSKDYSKAIVWCGHQKKQPPTPAELTATLPFVSGYDATFL